MKYKTDKPIVTQKFDINAVLNILSKEYDKHEEPVAQNIYKSTADPYKVLVSTILSSRTKDEITAQASKRLFAAAPTIQMLSTLSQNTIRKLIFPVGFYKTKARHLKLLPLELKKLFGGIIPQTVDELIKLPGVGRKTANLVVSVAFDKPAICVDIHVHRICNRLGYLITRTPLETEMVLRRILPPIHWKKINSLMVSFGRNTCTPRNPHCSICPILNYCKRNGVNTKYEPSTTKKSFDDL